MSQDQSSGSSGSTSFNPEEIIKKEARGLGDADLGEVQEGNGVHSNTKRHNRQRTIFYSNKTSRPF